MKNTINKRIAAPLAVLVLSSFALTPFADAREGARGGGGGGGGTRASAGTSGGGGARANAGTSGSGAARGTAGSGNRQVDNTRQDARTNNVRGTSVNNVNANRNNVDASRNANVNSNRNVNVNVDGNNGCCNGGGGWDNPLAAAAVVTATVVGIGSLVNSPPSNANCVPVNHGGVVYQQCGSTWYQPQGSQYVVVQPPY